jgi:hypothetical protein
MVVSQTLNFERLRIERQTVGIFRVFHELWLNPYHKKNRLSGVRLSNG